MTTIDEPRSSAARHAQARADHLSQRGARAQVRRTEAELQSIARQASVDLADASADEVGAWAARQFSDLLAVACSMADAVLPAVVSGHAPWVDILFLDTGYHFAETLGTRDAIEATMRVNVVDLRPELSVAEQDGAHGKDLFGRDPGVCCAMRKVAPLARALTGYEAWVTGIRRDDVISRKDTPLVEWDEKFGLIKINPLARWSFDDLMDYATEHDVVVNPLLAQGYPSIGCAPCTRRVAPGDDPRSGRWAGLNKSECGLHE